MDNSKLADRIAIIRARFVARLAKDISDIDASLLHMRGDGAEATDAVEAAYRQFHDILGISATVGFEATARAAQTIDALLIQPFREHRGLSEGEFTRFRNDLASFRLATQTETQSTRELSL